MTSGFSSISGEGTFFLVSIVLFLISRSFFRIFLTGVPEHEKSMPGKSFVSNVRQELHHFYATALHGEGENDLNAGPFWLV